MIVLGIETSCDETAVSIIEFSPGESDTEARILANKIISQIDLHKTFGGVFPMMAKREHVKNLVPLLNQALEEAQLLTQNQTPLSPINGEQVKIVDEILAKEPELSTALNAFLNSYQGKPKIDLISVTTGPGLEPALWVGLNFAKALSYLWNIPCHYANHMEGHIVSSLLPQESFTTATKLKTPNWPALALLISGGHTEIVLVEEIGKYKLIGQTRDDAIGEAYDKVARILGLPYPGGPEISKLAEKYRSGGNELKPFLPRPMINSGDFDFSFAGLKTAVLYYVQELEKTAPLTETQKEEIACDFENACVEVLIRKISNALEEFQVKQIIIGGGVIANVAIRKAFEKLSEQYQILLTLPHKELTTDNALMIALVGFYHKNQAEIFDPNKTKKIPAQGNMKLS